MRRAVRIIVGAMSSESASIDFCGVGRGGEGLGFFE
jgi:hypothetical protein